MEVQAVTEIQSISSHDHNEQDCMEALIAIKWPNGLSARVALTTLCSHLTSRRIPLFECAVPCSPPPYSLGRFHII